MAKDKMQSRRAAMDVDSDEEAFSSEEYREEDIDIDEEEQEKNKAKELTFGEILKRKEKGSKKRKSLHESDPREGRFSTEFHKSTTTRIPNTTQTKQTPARYSKDAPTEMSSKFPVKRGRNWRAMPLQGMKVEAPLTEEKNHDPRFREAREPVTKADEQRMRRNYAFLDEYRATELKELREQVREAERTAKTRRRKGRGGVTMAAEAVAALREELTVKETQEKQRAARERERKLLEEHRKEERQRARDTGKTPYYLKKSEAKKKLLEDKLAGMSERQVEKAMERRRKKLTARERREMPLQRRTRGEE